MLVLDCDAFGVSDWVSIWFVWRVGGSDMLQLLLSRFDTLNPQLINLDVLWVGEDVMSRLIWGVSHTCSHPPPYFQFFLRIWWHWVLGCVIIDCWGTVSQWWFVLPLCWSLLIFSDIWLLLIKTDIFLHSLRRLSWSIRRLSTMRLRSSFIIWESIRQLLIHFRRRKPKPSRFFSKFFDLVD